MNLSDSRTPRQSAGQTAQRPIVRVGAAEAVLADLRGDIEAGAVPVGAKLPSEAALAARYGVSRSVVREALRSSAALGLTETHTGKGTFVVSSRIAGDLVLGRYSARDLTEARPHVEVPAAGLAALRRTEEDLATLRGIVAETAVEDEPARRVTLEAAFHGTIAKASGNQIFEDVLADLREALAHQSETLNLLADRQAASDNEHQEILDAIEAGSAERASAAMAKHLAAVDEALGLLGPNP
ncbi:FadR/GntR family transcriptional regulator [Sinomonas sp. ASV486]|uniref:FadR/GntR family transcriptional regulator n=1 Tax=Sinomonas sp. ASV486 TaxID=3051170 RepID=UPI0027DDAD0F|nr:FadR/GntR family transcriptional regulator [Sinomonas sp. ASV486]MDQ4490623.1 FadR/GntR family transcriptional regulator [Sinomonas sp. ASV486]